MNKVSVLIRNKNESNSLKFVLDVLTTNYKNDISEILVIDDHSTDDSIVVAESFGCRILKIDKFSYGRAINLGIRELQTEFILILSAHSVPLGKCFFKSSVELISSSPRIAAVRYINNIKNFKRAFYDDFKMNDPLHFGLNAACCLVRKSLAVRYCFNEKLIALEDKEWSMRIYEDGWEIHEINETYFYFSKRNRIQEIKRWEKETLVHFNLTDKPYFGIFRIIIGFLNKVLLINISELLKTTKNDFLMMKTKIRIRNKLNKKTYKIR